MLVQTFLHLIKTATEFTPKSYERPDLKRVHIASDGQNILIEATNSFSAIFMSSGVSTFQKANFTMSLDVIKGLCASHKNHDGIISFYDGKLSIPPNTVLMAKTTEYPSLRKNTDAYIEVGHHQMMFDAGMLQKFSKVFNKGMCQLSMLKTEGENRPGAGMLKVSGFIKHNKVKGDSPIYAECFLMSIVDRKGNEND